MPIPAAIRPRQSPAEPLRLPAVPQAAERAPFPLIASLAPLVAAVAIWAVTHSPFVLLFALLGPVVAVAGVLDGKRQAKKRLRREAARFAADVVIFRQQLELRHREERRAAWQNTPPALVVDGTNEDHGRWKNVRIAEISLGRGTVSSTVSVDSAHLGDEGPALVDQGKRGKRSRTEESTRAGAFGTVRELRTEAAMLHDAPVVAPFLGGIAVVGPAALATSVARGLVVQMVRATAPSAVVLSVPETNEWAWVTGLPHCSESRRASQQEFAARTSDAPLRVQVIDRTRRLERSVAPHAEALSVGALTLAIADSDERVPPGCSTILRVDSGREAVVIRAQGSIVGTRVVPELLGRQQASTEAEKLIALARAAGLMHDEASVPARVSVHDVDGFGHKGEGLNCVLGLAAHGTIELDLVANGPHALVGGTTGSGKSEFLVSWVLALAAAYDPSEFTVLLVDFKGGAAFGELERLPQCVGLLTDLDEHEASRALVSLRAELRYREQRLRAVRARDISDPQMSGRLPRLVIVVDEFAAMLSAFPELHEAFVDIAARGRSLGMHLVLCTQRPGGVVRDALLANCSLRVSLRVNNREDSRAAIGSDDAALIAPTTPGRAFVATGDGRAVEFQSLLTEPADLAAVLARQERTIMLTDAGTRAHQRPRRPWLAPLPAQLTLTEVPALLSEDGGASAGSSVEQLGRGAQGAVPRFTLGVVDEPDEQRRSLAEWAPLSDGPLLVLGSARSGRTSILRALAEQAAERGIPVTVADATDPESYWDALVEAANPHAEPLAGVRDHERGSEERGRLLLLDDWDAVVARWPGEYQLAAAELLGLALRESRSAGIHLVVATGALSGAVLSHRALFDAALLLRLAEKSDHVRAGGLTERWKSDAPAGRGEWRGREVQCAAPVIGHLEERPVHSAIEGRSAGECPTLALDAGTVLIITSRASRALAAARARVESERGGASAGLDADGGPGAVEVLDLAKLSPGYGFASAGLHENPQQNRVIVGDPDAWQSQWALFSSLRPGATLVFDDCRLSDFRALSRQRELPPLLVTTGRLAGGRALAVDADGGVSRVRMW